MPNITDSASVSGWRSGAPRAGVAVGRGSPDRWSAVRSEAAGGGSALIIAAAALAVVGASPRAWVLFLDGDSLLFALVHASLAVGQVQRWTLTSPLFIPEAAIYLPVSLLGAPVRTTLILDGLLNWLAYYAVVRAVASTMRVRRPVAIAASVTAVAALALAAACEASPDRNALEPASLLDTTTYYSGTVIATVGLVALVATSLRTGRRTAALLGAAALTAGSVLTNPLFIAWAAAPACLACLVAIAAGARVRRAGTLICGLVVASGIGLAARIPFHEMLVQDSAAKIRPDLAGASLAYNRGLLAERLATPAGWVELLLMLLLLGAAVIACSSAVRTGWVAGAAVAGFAVVGSASAVVGAIALGTFATRYLQPAVFLPPLALLVSPRIVPWLAVLRARSTTPGGILVAIALGVAGPGAVGLVHAAGASDTSVTCVTAWLAEHPGRTGIGEYWTVRAPKAYARDPRQLVQVDAAAAGYDWLVNRDDLRVRTYSFTVTDAAQDPALVVPARPVATVRCGRYVISDYGTLRLPIGEAHQ